MSQKTKFPFLRSKEEIEEILKKIDYLDEIDLKIVWELQNDGRASFNEIAKKLGISVATVSKRVGRLEKIGVIQGYSAIVACEKIGFKDHIWLMVYLQPNADIEAVGMKIANLIGVKCVHQIYGEFDLLVHLCCATDDEINEVVNSIGKIRAVVRVHKMKVSKRIKEEFRVQV